MHHVESLHQSHKKRAEIIPNKIPIEFYEDSKSMHCVKSFHQFLEKQSEVIPNEIAIEFYEDSISYLELNNKSNEFAHYLKKLKLNHGDRVGIYASRSIELLIILMGILKCGAVCVPIDINLPETQVGYILNKTKLKYMVTYGLNLPKFINNLVDNVIEYNVEDFSNYPKSNLDLNVQPSDLSYILYTSGSTGIPKGVELEHKGIVNLAFGKVKFIRLQETCRILQFSSVAFDAILSEIGIQMLTGGTLVMVKYDDILPGKPLIKTLNENKINVIISAPSVLGVIQDAALPYMQVIISAGEICPPKLANKFSENCMFVNAYGPTEASVCSTMYHVVNPIKDSVGSVPIGKPIGGIKIKLLNERMEETGLNEVGELYVGGVGVARGYFAASNLTEEKFVVFHGERFFKTGDLVRLLEDGNLEYIGRIDRQIKYHGIRVNLNEIEQIIDEHKDVDISAAILKDGNLVVYIQKKPHSKLDSKELRRFLEGKIPNRIFPDLFFFVPKIKLTISNKIDYKYLGKYSKKTNRTTLVDTLNWSEDEVSLLEILRNVLVKCNDIKLHDDFFNLGLSSFGVATFSDEISKKFNIDMLISKIYEHSSIKKMANYIKNVRMGSKESFVDFLKESEFKGILT